MVAACDSAADLPTKERFGPVRFELFFGSFSLQ
jgi:hypothetical protein